MNWCGLVEGSCALAEHRRRAKTNEHSRTKGVQLLIACLCQDPAASSSPAMLRAALLPEPFFTVECVPGGFRSLRLDRLISCVELQVVIADSRVLGTPGIDHVPVLRP